jgi:hypothetical protein
LYTIRQKITALQYTTAIYDNSPYVGFPNANTQRLGVDFLSGNPNACLGYVKDQKYYPASGFNVVRTNLLAHIFNKVVTPYEVLAIARKPIGSPKYDEIKYSSEHFTDELPQQIKDYITTEANEDLVFISTENRITADDFEIKRIAGTQLMSIELDNEKGGGKFEYNINLPANAIRIAQDFNISRELATALFTEGQEYSILDNIVFENNSEDVEFSEELTPQIPTNEQSELDIEDIDDIEDVDV